MSRKDVFRVPNEALLVPPRIIELAKKFPAIACNLRPSQTNDRRGKIQRSMDNAKEWLVSPVIVRLLKKAGKTKKVFPIRMVILTQGILNPSDVGTAVLDIHSVVWDSEYRDYPGFIFDHPTELGVHILWGGYILAFACIGKRRAKIQVEMREELFTKLAPKCEKLSPKEGAMK